MTFPLPDERPYVIGEIGFNHDGDPDVAGEMIERLADAGADCAKVQLFRTEHLVSSVHASEIVDVFREHELSRDDYLDLCEAAENMDIDLAASVFDRELLDWYVEETDPPFVKIASGDITYHRLLSKVGNHDVPVIMSTGASTLDEIDRALEWINADDKTCHLLYCVSRYPTPDNELHLRRLRTLRNHTDMPVGFSDHSTSRLAPRLASAMGASVWERHVTLDPERTGPEHAFSLPIDQLPDVIETLSDARGQSPVDLDPDADTLLGSEEWELSEEDVEFRQNARRSLMADRMLSAGSKLQGDMIRELRPGTGLPAERIEDCLGLRVQRPTDPQEMITY